MASAPSPARPPSWPATLPPEASARPPQLAAVPGPSAPRQAGPAADTRHADQLAFTMRLVKAARFNAAARLEQKQAASLFTQSMVALYFIGLSVYQAVYAAQIDEPTQRLITFLSIVSSVFTLMLGLLEALNDYQMKSHHLHNCALTIAELSQEISITRPTNVAELQEYRRRYNEALKACPVNHTRLDYLFAKLDSSADWKERGVLWLRYATNVYALYIIFLAVPPLLWWLHL